VVVIGAGVVGLAAARRLAASGRVVVLDRDPAGASASRAAAGMLAPRSEGREPGPFLELALAALRAYPGFAREIESETGLALDYREDGLIALADGLDEETELAARAEWQRAAGLVVDELTRAEATARWPGLAFSRPVRLGESRRFGEGRLFYFPGEAQVDARLLVEALLAACRSRGVEIRLGQAATGLRAEGERVIAVRTSDGEIPCGGVLNAAGAWAGVVACWVGEALPVEPVRGEMIAFATRSRPPRPVVAAGTSYALLRAEGELLVGATVERAGFEARTTADGQAWLEARARALAPELAGRTPAARWAGLRPGTPDGLPILGWSSEAANLYHAAGHFRNGILLAPLTAEIVAEDLERGPVGEGCGGTFAPARFASRAGDRP
jgi:glycine oxidase